MATPTNISDPRQAIADAFSQFQQGFTPSGPTSDQIAGLFAPLLGDVQSEQAPLPRPIPQGLNPLQAFAGALASNMGSALTRNPMFAQNFARTIQEQQQRQQAVEDQNYLEDLAFNKEKRNRLLTIRASAMEKQIENLMAQGKEQDAAKLAGQLEKLRGNVEMAVNEAQVPGRVAEIRAQGEEARKLESIKAGIEQKKIDAAEKKATDAANKPYNMSQYQDDIRDVMHLTPEQLQTKKPGWFGIGGESIPKGEMLEQLHAKAATSPDKPTATAGRRALIMSISKRLGIKDPTNATKKEADLVNAELARYGVQ